MKKLSNGIVLLLISFHMVSCTKSNESIISSTDSQPSSVTKVPNFNESNSTKITWDQLPEKLRNATPLSASTIEAGTGKGGPSLRSYYGYSVGPWGGARGSSFSITPPTGSRIYAIAIRSGAVIDRLTIWYITETGTIYLGLDNGGNGGSYYLHYFSYDEYIYYVFGRSGGYVDHLSFYTNKKSFSYGGSGGSPFAVGVSNNNQILGFYGASGTLLDRIGFYVYNR